LGVGGNVNHARRWLTAVVLLHLVISVVHGWAHTEADVPLSRSATLFVYTVILAGPLVGLVVTWPAERIGAWLVAMTMAGSFVFGLVNHFVFDSPDHVAHVARQWRALFATTAVLLALTEAIGFVLAIRLARGRKNLS
jgi:hypothetical protein